MTQDYYEELRQFLPGLSADMPETILKLAELFRAEAFELHMRKEAGETKYYIPYMMNDALECFLILESCRMTGICLPDFKGAVQAHLARENGEYLLVVRQGEDNVFTLWFSSVQEKTTCYQYHWNSGDVWYILQEPFTINIPIWGIRCVRRRKKSCFRLWNLPRFVLFLP